METATRVPVRQAKNVLQTAAGNLKMAGLTQWFMVCVAAAILTGSSVQGDPAAADVSL